MKIKTVFTALTAGLLAAGAITQQAQATPINGSIVFLGSGSASGASGAGTTTLTFNNPYSVITGSGSYFGASGAATLSTVKFTGTGTGAVLTAQVSPQWTFTDAGVTYSFDLTSLTSGTVTIGAGLDSVDLAGMGTAKITGFTDTAATWSLEGTGTTLTFTFETASTTATGTVPDGGLTLAMLGGAMIGLQGLRRKLGF